VTFGLLLNWGPCIKTSEVLQKIHYWKLPQTRFFFANFVMLPHWWSSTRGISQIWLQLREDRRKTKNPVIFWCHVGTYCLNMAKFHQKKFIKKELANLVLILKKIICISCPGFFHCCQVVKISQNKKCWPLKPMRALHKREHRDFPRNKLGAIWIALEFENIWGDLGNSGTCTLDPESWHIQ